MSQLDLFHEPGRPDSVLARTMARTSDPETSHMAAVRALPNVRHHRLKALEAHGYFGGKDGLTDHELAQLTGIQQASIGVRRGELRDAGLVEPLVVDGRKVRRLSPSGSPCQAWIITQAGLDMLNAGGTP